MTVNTVGAILGAIDTLSSLGCDEDAADLQDAYVQLKNDGTIALPAADYGTRPVTPHLLDTIAAVKTFMRCAGQEVKPSPGQPTPEVLKLRLNLELEELYEKAQAFGLEGSMQQLMFQRLKDKACFLIVEEEPYAYLVELSPDEDTLIYNAVEVLDAAVDQRYVQDGTVLACGLQDAFAEAFADVQASNMSKFPGSTEEADATVEKYAQEGVDAYWNRKDGIYAVRRTSDNKVLKSINYAPANLGPILERHVR